MRLRAALLLLLASPARAATGGPDGGEMVWTDSDEAGGPTHVWLDATGGDAWPLEDDATVTVDLPFPVRAYGVDHDTLTVSSNGVLFFSGATSAAHGTCPDTGGLDGVAVFWDDLAASTVYTATFGVWPSRTFVVSWPSVAHATAGGEGRFQAWFVEGRGEIVLVLDDLDFGDPAVDGGAGAVLGTGDGTDGLAYACGGGVSDGTTVWFGASTSRPAAGYRTAAELDAPWYGVADFAYAGRALATGDVDGDGAAEVLVGDRDRGAGAAYLLYRPYGDGVELSEADATLSGDRSGDALGASLGFADLDGDGAAEVLAGAPDNDGAGSGAGAVYLWEDAGFGGAIAVGAATATWTGPATGQARAGTTLLADADLDGDGYADLAIGAPAEDGGATDAGAVYILPGGAVPSGTVALSTAPATFRSSTASEGFGTALAAGDLDGDGAADLVVGAPESDAAAMDAGAAYVFAGGAWSGVYTAGSAATCRLTGAAAGDRLGTSLLLADLDASGALDLVTGAPTVNGAWPDAGAVYVLLDPGTGGCAGSASLADATVTGTGNASNLGATLAAGDFDGDGTDDLVVAAPNATTTAAGGGALYVFTGAPAGTVDADLAAHRVFGVESAGALGNALAVAHDTGSDTILAGAPYASVVHTGDGGVYLWEYVADFLDADGDGFVAATAGGNDCDDTQASAYPGGTDLPGDSIDGDCDGWVDGVIAVRHDAEGFAWDVAAIGAADGVLYDFETFADGEVLTTYADLTFTGTVRAQDRVAGTWPVGTRGAEVSPTSVRIDFAEPVDAIALRLLDPEGRYDLFAEDADGAVAAYTFTADADDRTGGLTYGFTFVAGVDAVTLTGPAADGFGLDDLDVVYASGSDRDGDGWNELEGDCDDADPAVSPDAMEDPTNGVDDDCDGIVDAGNADLYTDYATWLAATGVDPEIVDFEDVASGTVVADQYLDLGIAFADGPIARATIDGTPAHLTTAARTTGTTVTFSYEEPQPAVGLYLIDGDGPFTLEASIDGYPLYTVLVTPASHDAFVGLGFDFPVDELVVTGGGGEVYGVDDVAFNVLGLDDADGDGFTEVDGDCDDADASVYEGAPETWYDGVDGDCAGDDDYDADQDGFDLDLDCDDGDGATNPDADEVWYDGIDGDCSGGSDFDADRDGHDDRAWGGDDCDDGDASVNPDATDEWYDGVDADCAGNDDYDRDGDGIPGGITGGADCDDLDPSINPEAIDEPYDGIDADCSGEGTSDYDADGDGFDAVAYGGDDCADLDAGAYPGAPGERCYDGLDTDCDGWDDYDCDRDGFAWDRYAGEDCDDADPAVNPRATDAPRDGIDTNCDGALEFDDDGDGWDGVEDGGRDCDDTDPAVNPGIVDACYDGVDADCDGWDDDDCDHDSSASALYGGDDCDDFDRATWPGAPDYPYDGIDSDCDGADEFDLDGDGQTVSWYGGTDCDDGDATVYAGAPETCYDGVDQDCAGDSDDDCDADGFDADGYGGDDCDDADPSTFPGATETEGDGIDQDCDGADATVCTDCDGDGHAATAWGGDDCDDGDPAAWPGAPEVWYDGADEDCLGGDDYDRDGDGAAAAAWGGGDCDDTDATIGPFVATDGCDRRDDDCDGRVDEDCAGGGDDTGPPADDTGPPPDDTGTTQPTDDSGDWRPDPDAWVPAEVETIEAKARGCGCASGQTPEALGLALGVAAGVVGRRRRR